MYRDILDGKDYDWDNDEHYRYLGQTSGCGCCSYREPLTLERAQEHRAALLEEVERIEGIIANMERLGERLREDEIPPEA